MLYRAVLIALSVTFGAASLAHAQSASDLVVRIEQLENHIRQLTGQNEQLQYRNHMLEQQLQQAQGGAMQGQPTQAQPMQGQPTPPQQAMPAPIPQQQAMPPQAAQPQLPVQPMQRTATPNIPANEPSPLRPVNPGRGRDVFDPDANPNAPGAPRPLGALPAGQPSAPSPQPQEPAGARGGREPGSPLDLSTLSSVPQQAQPAPQAPAPGRDPGVNVAAVAPPSNSPKDHFDLGYGYVQRKDYALADETLREFLRRYPSDRLAPDAQYWLGESLFQRQRYRDAADAFLSTSTKYEASAKAPDALLRLGQSLAAMGEKETACATFGEVGRKYPRAPLGLKQAIEREQKRVRC